MTSVDRHGLRRGSTTQWIHCAICKPPDERGSTHTHTRAHTADEIEKKRDMIGTTHNRISSGTSAPTFIQTVYIGIYTYRRNYTHRHLTLMKRESHRRSKIYSKEMLPFLPHSSFDLEFVWGSHTSHTWRSSWRRVKKKQINKKWLHNN